eukprot:3035490-Ditylum_brightwellii.AAC.1
MSDPQGILDLHLQDIRTLLRALPKLSFPLVLAPILIHCPTINFLDADPASHPQLCSAPATVIPGPTAQLLQLVPATVIPGPAAQLQSPEPASQEHGLVSYQELRCRAVEHLLFLTPEGPNQVDMMCLLMEAMIPPQAQAMDNGLAQ